MLCRAMLSYAMGRCSRPLWPSTNIIQIRKDVCPPTLTRYAMPCFPMRKDNIHATLALQNMSVCDLSICQSAGLRICQSSNLAVCQPVDLSLCQSASLRACQSGSLSVCQPGSLSVCQVDRSVSLSVCQYASLSVCQHVNM